MNGSRCWKNLNQLLTSTESGNVQKVEAVSCIVQMLQENTDVSITDEQKDMALNAYLAELSSITIHPDSSDFQNNQECQPISPNKQRSVRWAPEPDSSDDKVDNKSSKKQKLLESDMPWFVEDEQPLQASLHPSCNETRRLLWAYNQDITKAKFFAKIAPNSPQEIPSSQWEWIFKGDAVNLHQIYVSLHHVIPNEERTGRLGDTEIAFALSEMKKWVRTALEWSSLWRHWWAWSHRGHVKPLFFHFQWWTSQPL